MRISDWSSDVCSSDLIGTDAASQVATLLLFSSLSTAVHAVKGIDRQRMMEFLIGPDRPASEFSAAFDRLRASAWYLHPGKGEFWFFTNTENLRKRLGTEADRMPGITVDAEMRRRLETLFRPSKGLDHQRVLGRERKSTRLKSSQQ